jgi:hypothetical protein
VRRQCAGALLAALALAGCGGSSHAAARASTTTTSATTTTSTTAARVSAPAEPLAVAVARVDAELRGIPQHGLVLGHSGAPVTITEYGDIDCALCAFVHNGVVPQVIARYVRSGRATLELRPVVESRLSNALALAAFAAGEQGRGWDFIQLAYRRSEKLAYRGSELDTGAPAESSQVMAGTLGLNLARWRADLQRGQWPIDIKAAQDVAHLAGFATYPVFLVRRADTSHGTVPAPYIVLGAPQTLAAFSRAIATASAARG